MGKFGFKEINEQNWLEPDEVSKGFVKISPAGISPVSGEDWLRHILAPKLLDAVHPDVQKLFEVARGALVYGYFFYPLYALGEQQLFRVAEAAVSCKCKAMGEPNPKKTFEEKIEWLANRGVISETDIPMWHAIRNLRNFASHPKSQLIISPGEAISSLKLVSEKINALFNENSGDTILNYSL
jgi:hypothetical protein